MPYDYFNFVGFEFLVNKLIKTMLLWMIYYELGICSYRILFSLHKLNPIKIYNLLFFVDREAVKDLDNFWREESGLKIC